MRRLATAMAASIGILAGCAGPVATPTPAPTTQATADASMRPMTVVVPPDPHDGALAMTVTVPSALWRFDSVARGFTTGGDNNEVPSSLLLLWTFPAGTEFWVYGDPCQWQSTRPTTPATTASKIVAGLAAQASRAASDPVDVTVGGYRGKSVTLHVPNDAVFADCDLGDFTSYGVTGDEPTRYHQGPGQIDEFWVVDVDGAIAVLDATYRADTPADLIEDMRGIVESATFDTP